MASHQGPAKTVLLVEDQPSTVRVLRERLTALAGLQVRMVRTLNGALIRIEEQKPDLVILDLYLPDDWDRLRSYRDRVQVNDFNQGELLGAFLKGKGIPYFYYTSHLPFYRGDETELVMSKAKGIDNVVAKIQELLEICL